MAIDVNAWLERAASFTGRVGMLNAPIKCGEAATFAVSMATAFYGPQSPQLDVIKRQLEKHQNDVDRYEFARGCISNMAAEVRSGIVQNVRLSIAGEILADLITLAREALSERAIPVAAVLTAATFEDLMRRLALEKAGISKRIKLEEVIRELKDKGVLQGGEPGVAQSFLKFRNDSLHADWNNVTESQVTSCLGLLDTLIVKHLA